jgi:hypothetical protein
MEKKVEGGNDMMRGGESITRKVRLGRKRKRKCRRGRKNWR